MNKTLLIAILLAIVAVAGAQVPIAGTPVLQKVVVTPAAASITVGGTRQMTALPLDQAGRPFAGATIRWTSSNTDVATVDLATGVVTGVAPGTARITAQAISGETIVSGTATITVAFLASVSVAPAAVSVTIGGTLQLAASAFDALGNPLDGATITWSSSNPAVATVDANGLVTGGSTLGTVFINATAKTGTPPVNATMATSTVSVATPVSTPMSKGAPGFEAAIAAVSALVAKVLWYKYSYIKVLF